MHDQIDFALGAAIVARDELESGAFKMRAGEALRPRTIQRLSHPRGVPRVLQPAVG